MPAASPTVPRIPVLETARLRLRAHDAGDFGESAAMWGDPEIVRHIGGRPSTREEAWGRLLRYPGHWALLGFGYWAVEEKATGAFIGDVGFADYRREIEPPLDGMPELGWVLARRGHGKGYATEAAQAALGWGDVHLGAARTACIIAPENRASVRVAEKCGYELAAETTYMGEPTLLFTRAARRPAE